MGPNIALSGYYGFGNVGDEAVLDGIAATVAALKIDARLTALSINPRLTETEHPGISAMHRYKPLQLVRAIRRARVVISGGGSLLQDATSARSLQYYLFVLRLARLFRRKTMIYAQGIGPLTSEPARRGVAAALNRVSAITVRDQDSKALLESIGVSRVPIQVVADPSFLVDPDVEAADGVLRKWGVDVNRPILGISLRSWGRQETWLPAAVEGIARACDELGLTPVAIPMQPSEDTQACRAVKGVVVIDEPVTPGTAKGIVSRCSMLVGMRLHSLMFAAGTGVPFVGLSYDPKVRSFVDSVEPGGAVDIELLDPGTLAERIARTWDERESARAALIENATELRRKALVSGEVLRGLLAAGPKEQ